MKSRWMAAIIVATAGVACTSTPSSFGECGSDDACTRVSVCLCNRSTTCGDICGLGPTMTKECFRYDLDGRGISYSVTADDCAACSAVETGFDPETDCRAPITCPSGCSAPDCCATAADCSSGRGCVQGCCRTIVAPPDAGPPDSGRPPGCPSTCGTSSCCGPAGECSGTGLTCVDGCCAGVGVRPDAG